MPACPLTSQPSHHQSPPSHRIYRKPSVRLSRHVTSRHVARRCCALWCCDVHTAPNGATTENNSFRVPSPLPEYRQCPRLPPSEKKRKKSQKRCFFRCCPPLPSAVVAPQKPSQIENKSARCSTAEFSPSITTTIITTTLPPPTTTTTTTTTTNHPINRLTTGCCDSPSSLRLSFSFGDGSTHRVNRQKNKIHHREKIVTHNRPPPPVRERTNRDAN